MAPIPANPVTQNDLTEWDRLTTLLTETKIAEALLRSKIFKGYFPEPVEGTNTAPLNAGWVIKATHTINRKVLIDKLNTMSPDLRKHGIPLDDVIVFKNSRKSDPLFCVA